jgi:hypothetical protein
MLATGQDASNMPARWVSGIFSVDRTIAFVVVPQRVRRVSRVERDTNLEDAMEVSLPVSTRAFRHLLGGNG